MSSSGNLGALQEQKIMPALRKARLIDGELCGVGEEAFPAFAETQAATSTGGTKGLQ
jgi:hypothetical protein